MTFWKGKTMETVKKVGMKKWNIEDFQNSENTPYGTLMYDTDHYTFLQSHRMWKTESALYRKLWTLGNVMMCQCRFISCNKGITLWGMLIMGDALHVSGAESTWEHGKSVPPS